MALTRTSKFNQQVLILSNNITYQKFSSDIYLVTPKINMFYISEFRINFFPFNNYAIF